VTLLSSILTTDIPTLVMPSSCLLHEVLVFKYGLEPGLACPVHCKVILLAGSTAGLLPALQHTTHVTLSFGKFGGHVTVACGIPGEFLVWTDVLRFYNFLVVQVTWLRR